MTRLPKFKALVEITLRADDEDSVDDLVHAIWGDGDPTDTADATVWVKDIERVVESSS